MRRSVLTMMVRWLLLVPILLGWFAFSSARVADAHAILDSSSPVDQSVLDQSPARVRLTFSEPVGLMPGSVRVFDSQGRRVDDGLAQHGRSDAQVTVSLQSDLADGSYAVAWRMISSDSHPVHGGFVFSVRRAGTIGDLSQYLDDTSRPGWEATGDVLRGITYLGTFLVVGAAVFAAFVQHQEGERRRRLRLLTILGTGAILAQVAQLGVVASLATGGGPGSVFEPGVLAQVLHQGIWITIVGSALAVTAALIALAMSSMSRRWWALGALVLLAGSFVASGHTRGADEIWLISLVAAIHVAAGAVWVGGVAMLVASTRGKFRNGSGAEGAAKEVARFSRVATVSIVAVGVAGGVLAYVEIGSWQGLFTTGYGQLVVAKIALLAVLAGLGGYNHFRLVPVVHAKPNHAAAWGYLRRTLRAEAVALVAVLALTGVLVNAVPSRNALEQTSLYSQTADLGTGTANLVIDPAHTGRSALHLYLLDPHGRVNDDVESVTVQLFQPALEIGPIDHELNRAGPGHFVANGVLFTVPGKWTVTIRVRVDEFTERSAVFNVDVSG